MKDKRPSSFPKKKFNDKRSSERRDDRSESRSDRSDRPRGDRPKGDRPDRGDRPYRPRGEGRPNRGGDRSYRPREGGGEGRGERGDRPYRPRRPDGERPDRGDRPYRPRGEGRPDRGDRPQGDRPYRPRRPDGDRPERGGDRPYRPRGDRPQGDRPDRGDRPYRPRGEGRPDRGGDRPYRPRGEGRPQGDRPRGGAEHRQRGSDGKRQTYKRYDPQEGNYYIYGKHAVVSALQNTDRDIHHMLVTDNALASIPELAEFKHVPFTKVTNDELDRFLKDESVHQGVVLEVSPLPERALEDLEIPAGKSVVVVLDQVSDPHNVGAIIRSAVAFGATAVIITEHHAAREAGVMAKASSGALERIPLITAVNLATCLKDLKSQNFWIVGLEGESKTEITAMPDYERVALVMGAEGKGLRRLTAENCDVLVKIPIGDAVESLNVSNAAAVALYALNAKK